MSEQQTYDFLAVEQKWQTNWLENNTYQAVDNDTTREKKYILVEFPFPSGESLHVGHCFRYTVPDIYARFLRMKGYNVLFPMGWDAFGLPTEERARKEGVKPQITTAKNIANLKSNIQRMGYGVDWNREFSTADPEYYKWTQWIFTEFYKAGLAVQKDVELWYCEALGTVLANEEVYDGPNGNKLSERGDHPVHKKTLKQWVLKMPEYAEKLLQGLDETHFPEHVKAMQRQWIGKSEGVIVDWELVNPDYISLLESYTAVEYSKRESPEDVRIDLARPLRERTSMLIQIKETGKFVTFRRKVYANTYKDFHYLPGVGIDDGDTPYQAGVRETLEEVGIDKLKFIADLGTLKGMLTAKSKLCLSVTHYFLVECLQADFDNRKMAEIDDIESDENGTFEFVDIDTLKENSWEELDQIIENYHEFLDTGKVQSVIQRDSELKKIQEFESKWVGEKPKISTFTTRVDTLPSTTFVVVAPEYPDLLELASDEYKLEVANYIEATKNKSERERQINKEKSGVFTGRFVRHPFNGQLLPVWAADFVLGGYGTGAVMGNAHDERDSELAEKYGIYLQENIAPETGQKRENEQFADGGCGVVFDPEAQKYAFAQLPDGKFLYFAGGRNEGESIKDAVTREVREESGLYDFASVDWIGKAYAHYMNPMKQIPRVAVADGFLVVLNSTNVQEHGREEHETFQLVWKDAKEVLEYWQKNNSDEGYSHYIRFLKEGVAMCIAKGVDKVSDKSVFAKKPFTEDGFLYGSGEFDGLTSSEARAKIGEKLVQKNSGKVQTNYRMRDFVFSRQRYWGEPFPIEYDMEGNIRLLEKSELPLMLPDVDDYEPSKDGQSPLAKTDWIHVRDKPKILYATTNSHKIELMKFAWKYQGLDQKYQLLTLKDLPDVKVGHIEENTGSFEGDALLKAKEYAKASGLPTISQDRGFEITALNNWPGTDSKKVFYGTDKYLIDSTYSDRKMDNIEMLRINTQRLLDKVPADNRQAFVVQAMAIALPDGIEFVDKDRVEGTISNEIRGEGEAFDWLFVKNGETQTLGEINSLEFDAKNIYPILDSVIEKLGVLVPESSDIIGRHEADTMPNWAGSNWYFTRFTDPQNSTEFASMENMKYWLPVDHYFGGGEHTTIHLLYSRFLHKFLFDQGLVPTPEPFDTRWNGGILLGPDGSKMSKSKENVVSPVEKLESMGADALRLYIAFIGPYDGTVVWQDSGLKACKTVVDRVWNLQAKMGSNTVLNKVSELDAENKKLVVSYHKFVRNMTLYIEEMRNNVAVAEIMTFSNLLKDQATIPHDIWQHFVLAIGPFTPHLSEELWSKLGKKTSAHLEKYPTFDPVLCVDDMVTMVVQINGKVRGQFETAKDSSEKEVITKAKESTAKWLDGATIKFVKVIPNKLVTLVVG
jgi:leucyl-tRNA synthetase